MSILQEAQLEASIDTPDVGFVRLFYKEATNQWGYKDSSSVFHYFSEGVTREEVEDLLANSFQDSATITWIYNDVANYFEANIESSVLTSINSALQPNDNISELNNDSNFETPAQLNTRDANNRNRANHTNTQPSSTISDFSSAVRSTILTGLSFATSSLVVASDSILIALGKIQAQISLLVFGKQAQDFVNTTQVNFSGGISLVRSYTTQSNPIGRYRISVQVQFEPSATNNNDEFELRIDGNPISLRFENEAKDTGTDIRNVIHLLGYYQHTSAGTFDIEIWGGNAGGTTELNGSLAEVWRVS